MFRSEGLRVATVVSGNKAKLVQVVPGRDYGTRIEIISGLDANSEVITNPPDSVTDGITVRVVQPDADKNKQAGAASQQGGGSSQNQGGLSGTPSQNQNTAPSQNQQEKK
jgi:hypothetical protein